MDKQPKKKRGLIARLLTWLATLPVVVLGVGFIFHTSFAPDVLGKYSSSYFVFLLCWWLLLTPAIYFFARFVFDTQEITLLSGRVLRVRPSPKILLFGLLGWGMAAVLSYRIDKALGHGVTTPQRTDMFHPYLQNVPKNHPSLNINYYTFRGTDIQPEKEANTIRVFALGGSTTFSGPLALEDTYLEMLGAKLRAAYPDKKFEMQNAGGEWHSSQHSLIKYLTHVQDFDPDLILVFHAINDLGRSLSPDLFAAKKGAHYFSDYRHFLGPVTNLVRKDTTTAFLRMRFGYWFSDFLAHKVRVHGPEGKGLHGMQVVFFDKTKQVEIEEWKSLSAYERNMRELVRAVQANGTQIVLASQPHLYREDLDASERERLWLPVSHQFDGQRASLASMVRGMNQFNALTKRIADDVGVGFVDLDTAVPRTTEYLWDDVHHTKAASAKIAEAFFDHIRESKILNR